MWKSLPLQLAASTSVLALLSSPCQASGPFIPTRWLEEGGQAVNRSPEFFWELELKRLAREFRVEEVRNSPQKAPYEEILREEYVKQAADADLADFQAAIKTDRLQPADANAEAQHKAARDVISAANEASTVDVGGEPPSEFADYHKGAFAFRKGEDRWNEAKAAWEALLARPESERHYRSTWAEFMLGKLAVFKKDAKAAEHFQKVRELAKQGFADSLGLAADSYGWEAKAYLDQGDTAKAAEFYLKQLTLGDETALVSLKACVPDRMAIEGMQNFDNNGREIYEAAEVATWRKSKAEAIATAAKNDILRRVTTAHILATETVYDGYSAPDHARAVGWLAAIKAADVKKVTDADRLGWVAYSAGRYEEAAEWLAHREGSSATALWLNAKLLRRAGKLKEAVAEMAKAFAQLRSDTLFAEQPAYTGPEGMSYSPVASAGGDLASLHLTRGDFVQAFDVFFTSGHWDDASFVAERVLTADELKQYVDTHPQPKRKPEEDVVVNDITLVLARRLVREDRYAEARSYFPVELQKHLDDYVAALKTGANEKESKAKRARSWWDAAVIARRHGMELMGTEVEPDGYVFGGSFESPRVADEREQGTYEKTSWETDGSEKKQKLPVVVAVSAAEKKRLAANRPTPNKRFHYRYIAAALAWKAAALLPDQSDELADVLNTAGTWIKGDSPAADKYFQAIERRASKTETGKLAGSKHWFVEKYGPWSEKPEE